MGNFHTNITGMVKQAPPNYGEMGFRADYQARVLTSPRKRTLHTMARGFTQEEE